MLCLDTTMLRKFENENKNQNKKNLRPKIYGKIRNGTLKLESSVLIKKHVVLYRARKEKQSLTNGNFPVH